MPDIPTTEPHEILAGDTLQWKKSLSDYPASGGWTLKYRLINASGKIDITAAADGIDHLITVTAATSAAYTAGTYTWTSYVEKGSGASLERYTLSTGTIIVKPSLATQTTGYDTRSHVKKVLDALESLLEGKASRDAQQITIAGQSITKMPPEELLQWRDYYADKYQTELAKENITNEKPAGNRIKVQF